MYDQTNETATAADRLESAICERAQEIHDAVHTKFAQRPLAADIRRELARLEGAVQAFAVITDQRTGLSAYATNVERLTMRAETTTLLEQAKNTVAAAKIIRERIGQ